MTANSSGTRHEFTTEADSDVRLDLLVANQLGLSRTQAATLIAFAPQQGAGDALRLTLVRTQGAAFGLYLGQYSRYIFMVLTVGALVILWRLYQATREGDLPRTLAIALVCAGALGNLIDRIRYQKGVVDFIDVGFRDMRWPTFNVADMAVSTGAFLLAWVLWGDDRAERARAAETVASGGSSAGPNHAS